MSDQSCPLSQFDRRRRTLIQQLPIQILKLKRFLINFVCRFLSLSLSLLLASFVAIYKCQSLYLCNSLLALLSPRMFFVCFARICTYLGMCIYIFPPCGYLQLSVSVLVQQSLSSRMCFASYAHICTYLRMCLYFFPPCGCLQMSVSVLVQQSFSSTRSMYVFCLLCSYMYLPRYVYLYLSSLWLSTIVSLCTCAIVFIFTYVFC